MSWKERSSFGSKRSLSETDGPVPETFEFKVVMVGTMGVGKTSLAARYVKDTYREFVNPTIGASYLWRKERIDDKEVKFSIWDTAGQEQFYALVPMYFRDAEAVILVVDGTRDTCEAEAQLWLEKVKQSAPSTALVFLVINKIDCPDLLYRHAAGERFCRSSTSLRMECFEVSAKTGEGVHELFDRIGHSCLVKHTCGDGARSGGKSESSVRLGSAGGGGGSGGGGSGKGGGGAGASGGKCKC